jgi:hypothetical protein
MTEQELILGLRELIAKASAEAPDPRLVAREISRSDQRQIRWLAGLSIFFWLLAAAGLALLCIGLDQLVIYVRIADFYPAAQTTDADKRAKDVPLLGAKDVPLLDVRRSSPSRTDAMLRGTNLIHHTIWIVAGSIGALFMAALCTVLLVTTSRRATLRQINLSLMQLAEQVRHLQSAPVSGKSG